MGQVLFQRPPARTGRASFPASWLSSDLLRGCRGGLPCVDGVVAGLADHEGLALPFCHELCPRGLWSSRCDEVGEFADLVDLDVGPLVTEFAPAEAESVMKSNLFADSEQGTGETVVEDRLLLPSQ